MAPPPALAPRVAVAHSSNHLIREISAFFFRASVSVSGELLPALTTTTTTTTTTTKTTAEIHNNATPEITPATTAGIHATTRPFAILVLPCVW